MEPKEIRELIELISRSDFAEFELEERDGFKLKLVREQLAAVAPAASAVPTSPPSAAAPAAPAVSFMTPASSAAASTPAPAEDGLIELKSPIVGTYYSSSAPESPVFVEVGARIKKGQVVCIVEAMKVMNEIESEFDAEVVEILVSNGQPVEFGEVLLRLRQP